MLETTKYKVVISLTEPMLGTVPKRKEVYSDYIATKAAEHAEKQEAFADGNPTTAAGAAQRAAEEVETVQDIEEKGWTGFHTDEDGPFLYDYAIKGYLCEAARTVKEHGSIKQLHDKFKRYVFVKPRRIRLPKIADKPLERPLRAMTAQGPRVTVTRSDVVEAGADITFELVVFNGGGITLPVITDVLSYGELMGLGQWRSGGYGRFEIVSISQV
jgi:DNA topoisomerase VI subunit B